jgi:alcohol dehydrogenase (cytochrome c)
MEWERAKFFTGGTTTPTPESRRLLRAIDVRTGRIAWELAHSGAADSWGGVVSTAGGIVIFCEESGALAAADATTGKLLWSFQTSVNWRASPMTYMFDNRQYVAVAAGPNILAFAVR